MTLAVVVSRADAASTHVGEHLLDLADWTETVDESRPDGEGGGTVYRLSDVELREFETLHLETTGVAAAFDDPDLLVFASRHAGDTGPLLTAHHTGNFGPAEYGGTDGSLARACPQAHRRVLEALETHAPDGYEVGMECTHHGPSEVGAPAMFVEVGSGEAQWDDPDAARAVARAIFDLRGVAPDAPREDGAHRHLVGFGGGHYAPRFERVIRETDWAVGHVAADWVLDEMGDPAANRGVLEQAFAESATEYALLDGDRPQLRSVVDDLGYRTVSETWARETAGVPLGLVDRLESAVGSVAAGLRFGALAREGDATGETEVAVVDLHPDLLAAANGVDREATREAVADATLAFLTEDSGTRAVGPVAVPDESAVEDVVAGLVAVLEESYDEVALDDGTVVASETAFDPELARAAGVPEGPQFGRLAAGEPVEVDGSHVAPQDVRREREHRFPVRRA